MNPNPVLALDEIDLSDLAFWARPLDEREAAFEALRLHRPVTHFEDPEPPPGEIPIGAEAHLANGAMAAPGSGATFSPGRVTRARGFQTWRSSRYGS